MAGGAARTLGRTASQGAFPTVPTPPPSIRVATADDIPGLRAVMARAIAELQADFLTPAQVKASHSVMGLDTRLIEDGTYFVADIDGHIAGCGGWSWRATLYGGDHSTALRNDAVLDPARDAAKVRAMYTHPDFKRRGVGAAVLNACLDAAFKAGFGRVELMATLAGEPLYRQFGFVEVEHVQSAPVDGVSVPLIRMQRSLDDRR
ncbi:MAG: GNAT family N-acetyltransferase [Alphaproteobacteria bacterium]|nr:GNAT family N-acetyltransferase [Alphaproteobacteria bacterium]